MGQEKKDKHNRDKGKSLVWSDTREADSQETEDTNAGGLKSNRTVGT